MRALVQRVSEARVQIDNETVGEISKGLLVFVGVRVGDSTKEASLLAGKVCKLRVFDDSIGKMNLSVKDVSGHLLVVSQFTLYGDTRKSNHPSYSLAASAEAARALYEDFVMYCTKSGLFVATGRFGADMKVLLVNDGPVTIFCSTDNES